MDACHRRRLSVILDVVYNHLGPEGNYLGDFGPYFSYKYTTPWGPALNYDESGSDQVRRFVVQNACYWVDEYHMDGLRLDAIDKILDYSPTNILLEIEEGVHRAANVHEKQVHVIAESDLNDPRIIHPKEVGGFSIDAQWSDDFHHSVHSYLTGERFGYYQDFGDLKDIGKSLSASFVYDGKYSTYRGRTHGAPPIGLDGEKFVYCLQNHDQVGNHPNGERLSSLLDFDRLKVAIALLFLSQSIPMIFMGEEYAESAPFYYFVDHSQKDLVKAIGEGRRRKHDQTDFEREFADPIAESTFNRSKLDLGLRFKSVHKKILEYYRDIISLRNSFSPFGNFQRRTQEIIVLEDRETIIMERAHGEDRTKCVFVLNDSVVTIDNPLKDEYDLVFDSTAYNEKTKTASHKSVKDVHSADYLELEPFSATVFARVKSGR